MTRNEARASELALDQQLYETFAKQPLAASSGEGSTDVKRRALIALKWLDRARLATDEVTRTLYDFFALEALPGDRSEREKGLALTFRRGMLPLAVQEGFSSPSRCSLSARWRRPQAWKASWLKGEPRVGSHYSEDRTRNMPRRALLVGLVLALSTGSCGGTGTDSSAPRGTVSPTPPGSSPSPPTPPRSSPSPLPSPRDANEELVYRVIEFARSPSRKAFAVIPLAKDGVWLGLGPRLVAKRSLEGLSKPRGWVLDVDYDFRAGVGPFSALDLLADPREVRVLAGPHPHCASPQPVPPPRKFAGLERLSVQPRQWESCLQWWTVDFFVSADGTIQAVTLDFWEP